MAYAAPSSGTLLSTSSIVATTNITSNTTGNFIRVSPGIRRRWSSKLTGIYASVSAPVVSSKPDDLVFSIISKVWLLGRLICSFYVCLGYSRISPSRNESSYILNLQVLESGIEQISSIFSMVWLVGHSLCSFCVFGKFGEFGEFIVFGSPNFQT